MSSIGVTAIRNNIALKPGLVWCLTPGQTLRHRNWQGEVVLYNDLSGDTYLLDESALHMLEILRNGPAEEHALAAAMRAAFERDDGEVDDASVAQLLADLQELALIDAVA